MSKKTTSTHRKERYKAQFARTDANRTRKRLKHLARHPNDLQTKKAIT